MAENGEVNPLIPLVPLPPWTVEQERRDRDGTIALDLTDPVMLRDALLAIARLQDNMIEAIIDTRGHLDTVILNLLGYPVLMALLTRMRETEATGVSEWTESAVRFSGDMLWLELLKPD